MRNPQDLTQPQTPTDQLRPSPAGWLGGEVVILMRCCFSWPSSRINSVISKSRIKLDASYSELQFVFYNWQAAGIVCQVTQGALMTLSWPSKDWIVWFMFEQLEEHFSWVHIDAWLYFLAQIDCLAWADTSYVAFACCFLGLLIPSNATLWLRITSHRNSEMRAHII